jgi:ketosteroid isomerase-like protein
MMASDCKTDDWAADFFRDADTLDLKTLATWFSDDVEVRFGNGPPITGQINAQEAFGNFWATITGMRHRREALLADGDMAMQFSQVTYTRHDGSDVTMPVASHLRRVGANRIDRLWIVIDLAPLFQAAM